MNEQTTENDREPCPKCGSKQVAKYQYGYACDRVALEAEVKAGRVKDGGCCVDLDSPRYHCTSCRCDWGIYDENMLERYRNTKWVYNIETDRAHKVHLLAYDEAMRPIRQFLS